MVDKQNKMIIIKHKENNIMKKNDTSVFCYYNCNPHSRRTEDCVIRAIASGTEDSWEGALKKLTKHMIKTGYMLSTPDLYGDYLTHHGWVHKAQPRYGNHKTMKIKDFVKKFKGRAIIHVGDDHVSYIEDGKLWDIWNCEDEIIGEYWIPSSEDKEA
jgi:hypothetical protein